MDNEYPKASIIIPVYNVEKYLHQCINSVVCQSFSEFEIVLVDDGSTDASAGICDEYASRDTRIKVVHQLNGGLSRARNRGIKEAVGTYVCFLDSDDYWEDKYFLSELMKGASGNDLILFRLKKYVERSGRLIESIPPIKGEIPKEKDKLLDYVVNHGQFIASACTKMVKRELLLENKIFFREGVTSEDIEWSGKVLLYSRSVTFVDVSGYIYRQRENSITSTMTKRNVQDLKKNIINSIKNAEGILNKTDRLYTTYMAYMAYQLATLLLCAHNVQEDMYPEIREMRKYAYVLRYSHNSKVILFNVIRRIIGFKGLYYASGLYMRLLYNRI